MFKNKEIPSTLFPAKEISFSYISKSVCCCYILSDKPARLQSTKVIANQTKKSTESKA